MINSYRGLPRRRHGKAERRAGQVPAGRIPERPPDHLEHELLRQKPARAGTGGPCQQADAHARGRSGKSAGDPQQDHQRRQRGDDLHTAMSSSEKLGWRRSFPTGVAPAAYFAGGFAAGTSQISAFCALAARSPCICSFANIGVLCAIRAQPLYLLVRKYRRSVRYRAQPLYLLTPAGRFALRATARRADASLRCRAGGEFAPLGANIS